MNKLPLALLLATAFVFSGCTVHHYHHQARSHKGKAAKHHGEKQDRARGGLPPGHPPVKGMRGHGMKGHGMKGHSMKGHSMKGHGMKGHGSMPKGHGKMGHGALPPGHPPVDGLGQGHGKDSERREGDTMRNPFERSPHRAEHGEAEHKEHGEHDHSDMDPAIVAFHDKFASAWHKEDDASRRTAACAQASDWKKLAGAIKKLSGGVVFTAATSDLHKQTLAVASSCTRKNGDVQAALVVAHDALHMLFRVAAKSPSAAKEQAPKPGF